MYGGKLRSVRRIPCRRRYPLVLCFALFGAPSCVMRPQYFWARCMLAKMRAFEWMAALRCGEV
jgi:hypothetical protein